MKKKACLKTMQTNRIGIARKIITFLMIFLLASPVVLTARSGSAGGGSEGLLTIVVEAAGLRIGEETVIRIEKEADGLWTVYNSKTINHLATFKIPFGGSCDIFGGDVAGYAAPEPILDVSLTQIKGRFVNNQSLIYTQEDITVTDITLESADTAMLVGETQQLTAVVSPPNASNQEVFWMTSGAAVEVVDGMVRAVNLGSATVTAASAADLSITDSCNVTVGQINEITDPDMINAAVAQVIELPDTVSAIVQWPDYIDSSYDVDVVWEDIGTSNTVIYPTPGTYFLEGSIMGTTLKAELSIVITGDGVTPATGVVLSPASIGIFIGATTTISITEIFPEGADISALKWESTAPDIAEIVSVTDGTAVIRGISSGYTIINIYLETLGKPVLDSCTVNVSLDPAITDTTYIIATEEDSIEPADQFATQYDVFIRGYGLTAGAQYYIKIEDQGSTKLLGEGEMTAAAEEIMFNLFAVVPFNLTESFSKSYFVSMSKDSSFPSGDYEDGTPKTLMDNFKITSPVPTGKIVVNVKELINGTAGDVSNAIVGNDVILGREIKEQTALETQYEDYLNDVGASPALPLYTDEVKLIGHVNPDGTVTWETPKESLKIGGYILLIELPNGYTTNLDSIYYDGELLKEVHITRNNVVYREIIVDNNN